MRTILMAVLLAGLPVVAHAGCEFDATGTCVTDGYGNTYRTQQNLGGGYNTYRNGVLNSQTHQNLSGGYTERFVDGEERRYDRDPYASGDRGDSYGSYGIKSFGD